MVNFGSVLPSLRAVQIFYWWCPPVNKTDFSVYYTIMRCSVANGAIPCTRSHNKPATALRAYLRTAEDAGSEIRAPLSALGMTVTAARCHGPRARLQLIQSRNRCIVTELRRRFISSLVRRASRQRRARNTLAATAQRNTGDCSRNIA